MCNSMLPKAAPKAAPQAARIIVGGGVSRLTHAFEVHRLARATGAGSEPADRPARHDADAREGPEGRVPACSPACERVGTRARAQERHRKPFRGGGRSNVSWFAGSKPCCLNRIAQRVGVFRAHGRVMGGQSEDNWLPRGSGRASVTRVPCESTCFYTQTPTASIPSCVSCAGDNPMLCVSRHRNSWQRCEGPPGRRNRQSSALWWPGGM